MDGDKPPEDPVAFDLVLVLRHLPVAALTNRRVSEAPLVEPFLVARCSDWAVR